jgi:hypothetical protein
MMCLAWGKESPHWGKPLSSKYNQKLIDSTCYNIANYYHAPRSRMLFFAPNMISGFTVGIISDNCPWEYWFGNGNSTLERLTVRFTTNDKDKKHGAIRELALFRSGDKYRRLIRVMQNPKWELFVDGEPQTFEEGKSYERIKGKRITEYFTLDDLIRFVNNWGCPFDKDEFWASDQPMYVFGQLDDDDNPDDWKDEDFEAWKKWCPCPKSLPSTNPAELKPQTGRF